MKISNKITKRIGTVFLACALLIGSNTPLTLKLTDEQIKKITDPKTAKLYYYDEATGKLVDMNAVFDLNAKTVTFTTDHFSKYTIVQEKATSAAQPSTGDNTTTVPVALALALAALLTLGTIIVVVKRKSHGRNDNQ